jgi:hypothetical protein
MIVMSRHLRTWNIAESRQEGTVCPTAPDFREPTTSRRGVSVTCIQSNRCLIFVGSGTYTEGLNRIGTRYQVPYPGDLDPHTPRASARRLDLSLTHGSIRAVFQVTAATSLM